MSDKQASSHASLPFPVVRVFGPPSERGKAYGAQARALIHSSIAGYEKVFRHNAGWEWDTVREHALRFAGPIGAFSPSSLAELGGIAEGAGLDLADVLALNTRSEIMFAARNRRGGAPPIHECTSFAIAPRRSPDGTTLAGQNWDWLLHARETTMLLEVERDDAPSFRTVVEAGLLAKVGLNEDGVALCTNTLISDGDEGRLGVPYHVLLRAVLDSTTGPAAADTVAGADRATSANYVIADRTGFVVDLETAPRPDGVRELTPNGAGLLTHANHFRASDLTGNDLYVRNKPHTLNRLRNVTDTLSATTELSVDALKAALADHRDRPSSVCQHPNEEMHPLERTATIAGIVMDVTHGAMHVVSGPPCEGHWHEWPGGD